MNTVKRSSAFKFATCISLALTALQYSSTAIAQDEVLELEEIVITGSRITQPGVVSSSPIASISAEEIGYLQEPEIEKILRVLPGTIPGDGGNVNNGSEGAATIDLRGLGPERNLIMTNGRRMVPFSFDGEVDTATIPTALVERIDVVTGGASAVYGSDAIAGAINFVLKRDFEGVEIATSRSEAGDADDGRINNVSLTLGSNLADDRGNVALSFGYMKREPVLLGQRDLGLLGIGTADGTNYQEFLAGEAPAPAPAGCGGPGSVAIGGGSTTSIPTRFAIVGAGASAGQFREDGTIGTECSAFNFNPFNYYQTPMERYSATAIGFFEVNEHAEVYSSLNFTDTTVDQQVAPSGTFGQPFDLPLSNPLIGDQARQFMIDRGNEALADGLLSTSGDLVNWQDRNGSGTVDEADILNVQLRRRTVELGPRTESFDADQFQIGLGVRGDIIAEWDYDLFFSYGESNRTRTRAGYTNLTNIQAALDTSDGVTCNNGDPTCVPINLFGGFGTISPEAAAFNQAIALIQEKYDQTIGTLTVNGPVEFAKLPWAGSPLLLSFGYEKRKEVGSFEPDECLKLAPNSCQGGAGGNLLPIEGSYSVDEFFLEGILPILEDLPGATSLAIEFGARVSDYDISSGREETWKIGFNWQPVDQLMVRAMKQQATRTANIGEFSSPVVTGLENAQQDPCSVANAANIDARLRDLCISTGMSAAQVGTVQDVISGQVATFDGSDPNAIPGAEDADTRTVGFVWTPDFDFFSNFTLSVDYYDIDIADVIGEFPAQEILDSCYTLGLASECAKINRIGGDLTVAGAGLERLTTNLAFERAEGVEVGFSAGISLGEFGELQFSANINKYLTQESQSDSFTSVVDCKGFYGTSCDPLSEIRWIQRTSWLWNGLTVSAQWRHIDAIDVEKREEAGVFEAFRSIDDYDYLDLFVSYNYRDKFDLSLGVDNVTEKDPPVVGNEAGDTAFNSGNTFPSFYDVLGRVYTLRFTAAF